MFVIPSNGPHGLNCEFDIQEVGVDTLVVQSGLTCLV